jgi:pimeloyl-ACP methyl ester carboxylesterase
MARALPRLEPVTVPGVGHAPDVAEPSLLGRIERFLDKI